MKKATLLLGVALLAMSSCCKKKNDTPTPTPEKVAERTLVIQPTVEGYLRALSLQSDGSGRIGGSEEISLGVYTPSTLTKTLRTRPGAPLTTRDLGLSASQKTFKLAGCYPVQTISGGELSFDATGNNADLLVAPLKEVTLREGATSQTVELPFRHAMHRLQLRLSSGDQSYSAEELGRVRAHLTALSTLKYNLASGSVSATGSKRTYTATGAEMTLLVVPQRVGDLTLEVEVEGAKKKIDLSSKRVAGRALTELESGKSLTITLDVRREGITITNTQIAPWSEQGTISDVINL